MQIFVRGPDARVRTLAVGEQTTLSELERAYAGFGVTAPCKFSRGGRLLQPGHVHGACVDGATFEAVLAVQGGHCMVPCGIFDDPRMVAEVKEMAATARKAVAQVNELFAAGLTPAALNQSHRWISTKEAEMDKLIGVMSSYCLCQRVKKMLFETEKDYFDALSAHHAVMQCAMKVKQSCDAADVDNLDHALGDCCKMYIKD
ncbi:nickel-containing superoxide dismutase-domain containing protein [Pelagophyceae sp. CCMP2097]|nr:nickel-containing superoxide dismutase-domain containing protein [Pelagophyceae sp. CCMP2097]